MKMGRRPGAGSLIDLDRLLRTASPARTALPAAHFDRNATTPVTDLVHWACWSSPRCPASMKSLGPAVQETDALLVDGGDALYLCYWMRQSGLADLLPSLRETVYVGVSAGSMVMAPTIGEDFVGWKPPTGGDRSAGTG